MKSYSEYTASFHLLTFHDLSIPCDVFGRWSTHKRLGTGTGTFPPPPEKNMYMRVRVAPSSAIQWKSVAHFSLVIGRYWKLKWKLATLHCDTLLYSESTNIWCAGSIPPTRSTYVFAVSKSLDTIWHPWKGNNSHQLHETGTGMHHLGLRWLLALRTLAVQSRTRLCTMRVQFAWHHDHIISSYRHEVYEYNHATNTRACPQFFVYCTYWYVFYILVHETKSNTNNVSTKIHFGHTFYQVFCTW